MFKMQMDVFEKIQKKKEEEEEEKKKEENLAACLWEGGVIHNTKNTKCEEVQKQTLFVLQKPS